MKSKFLCSVKKDPNLFFTPKTVLRGNDLIDSLIQTYLIEKEEHPNTEFKVILDHNDQIKIVHWRLR